MMAENTRWCCLRSHLHKVSMYRGDGSSWRRGTGFSWQYVSAPIFVVHPYVKELVPLGNTTPLTMHPYFMVLASLGKVAMRLYRGLGLLGILYEFVC